MQRPYSLKEGCHFVHQFVCASRRIQTCAVFWPKVYFRQKTQGSFAKSKHSSAGGAERFSDTKVASKPLTVETFLHFTLRSLLDITMLRRSVRPEDISVGFKRVFRPHGWRVKMLYTTDAFGLKASITRCNLFNKFSES